MKLLICLLSILPLLLRGEPPPVLTLPPNLACAGTTTQVHGQPWGYVVWNSNAPDWLDTHDVAVWRKPETGGVFELQGVMTLLSDPAAIQPWLDRALSLGDDPDAASYLAGQLYNQWQTKDAQGNPTGPPMPAALNERLSMLGGRARQAKEAAIALRQMGNARPIFRLLSGTAWAGPLGVANGESVVIELRDRNRTTGAEGGVVGRVTLQAGHIETLAAPGMPVQVPPTFLSALPIPTDEKLSMPPTTNLDRIPDLGVALRWSVPEALRRQALLTRGFVAWRLPIRGETPADAATLAQLAKTGKQPTDPGPVRALSRVPGPVSKVFAAHVSGESGPEVDDFSADPATFFLTDDNARYATAPDNPERVVGTPYADEERSRYYVAAVDLLGRYGPLSPAGVGTAAHTVPPEVPAVMRVENIMKSYQNGTPQPRLRVVWKPNANTPGTVTTTHYLVFRDRAKNTPPEKYSLDLSTRPSRRGELIYLGVVPHPALPGREMVFDDDALAPQADDFGRPYFYCIRAAHLGPFGYNLSTPSPAVFGTFRDREGPAAPSGYPFGDCPRAGIAFEDGMLPEGSAPVPTGKAILRVKARRGSTTDGKWKEVAWIQFSCTGSQGTPIGEPAQTPRLYFDRADYVWADFILPRGSSWRIQAVASTPLGRLSHTVEARAGENTGLDDSMRYSITCRVLGAPTIDMAPPGASLEEYWTPYFTKNEAPTAKSFTPEPSVPGTLQGTYGSTIYLTGYHTLLVQRNLRGVWFNHATAMLPPVTTRFYFPDQATPGETSWKAWEIVDPPGSPDPITCVHTARPADAPKIQPIQVVMHIPAGAREYRIYRRIDNGELVMIKEGTGQWDDAEVTAIVEDGMIPQAGGLIGYYGQCFDLNGNPSQLVLLREKVPAKAQLPIPTLSVPTPSGSAANPLMRIRASCPSPGVERMQLTFDPPLPAVPAGWIEHAVPEGIQFNLANGGSGSTNLTFSKALTSAANIFPGPDKPVLLDVLVPVDPSQDYTVKVEAVGMVAGDVGPPGIGIFKWTPPIAEGTVPWPARPVPQVVTWGRNVSVFQTRESNFVITPTRFIATHGPDYPIAVPLGSIPLTSPQPASVVPTSNWEVRGIQIGDARISGYLGIKNIPGFDDNPRPPDLFHRFLDLKTTENPPGSGIYTADFTRTLFPVVLYRRQTARQVGDAILPTPDTDITQVSPMISRIAWAPETAATPLFALLIDPFVGAVVTGSAPYQSVQLCLFDNTPVAIGATYQYYLMHFDQAFEPDLIIDADTVTINPPLP